MARTRVHCKRTRTPEEQEERRKLRAEEEALELEKRNASNEKRKMKKALKGGLVGSAPAVPACSPHATHPP